MRIFPTNRDRSRPAAALFLLIVAIAAGVPPLFAHGGEDHGAEQAKTTAGEQGAMLRTVRLGELEITLKHPPLTPDTPTSARLFITRYETNEPDAKAQPAVEIESAAGSVVPGAIEKSEAAGSYGVRLPALPEGSYTIRAKLTYGGETDTATFSGVEVAPAAADQASGPGAWRSWLVALIFSVVLALLGGLVYFVLRQTAAEPIKQETVSM
jgi:hypothetical protein